MRFKIVKFYLAHGLIPAKIIGSTNGSKIEVRFFGSKHEKAFFDRQQLERLDLSEDNVKARRNDFLKFDTKF